MTEIVFTYTGKIGRNHGIDGVQDAVEGQYFKAETVQQEKWVAIWLADSFAVVKQDEPKKVAINKKDAEKTEEKTKDVEDKKPSKKSRKKKGK